MQSYYIYSLPIWKIKLDQKSIRKFSCASKSFEWSNWHWQADEEWKKERKLHWNGAFNMSGANENNEIHFLHYSQSMFNTRKCFPDLFCRFWHIHALLVHARNRILWICSLFWWEIVGSEKVPFSLSACDASDFSSLVHLHVVRRKYPIKYGFAAERNAAIRISRHKCETPDRWIAFNLSKIHSQMSRECIKIHVSEQHRRGKKTTKSKLHHDTEPRKSFSFFYFSSGSSSGCKKVEKRKWFDWIYDFN